MLLTLVLLFAFQGETIINNPLHIVLIAVPIALFGTSSPAALATTVGVLTEVPIMLFLVNIANRTRKWFPSEGRTL